MPHAPRYLDWVTCSFQRPNAAAYAVATAAAPHGEVPTRAATAVGYTLDAAEANGDEAFHITLEASETDAELLERRFSSRHISKFAVMAQVVAKLGA